MTPDRQPEPDPGERADTWRGYQSILALASAAMLFIWIAVHRSVFLILTAACGLAFLIATGVYLRNQILYIRTMMELSRRAHPGKSFFGGILDELGPLRRTPLGLAFMALVAVFAIAAGALSIYFRWHRLAHSTP
jgi:hypothetical protein